MKTMFGQFWRLGLITILAVAGSIIAGLLKYGSTVLNPMDIGFAFVSFGLSGGFVFAFYHVRGLSSTITAAVSVSAVQFVASSFQLPIINAAIWSFGVNIPVVVLAFLFERKLAGLKQWKFVVVGVTYGAMFVLLTLIVGLITRVEHMPASVFQENFMDGLFLGLGVGIGVEIAESFVHSIEEHRGALQ